jgi:Fur family transcriptional regulator, peroxide stress response regulator
MKNREAVRDAAEVDALCSRFEAYCHDRGVRVTMQRMAVYRALAEDTTHPSAHSICDTLRRAIPSLALATVYRILESLADEGIIRRVSTTNGILRFDANLDPHQHFTCRVCGQIRDVKEESLSGLQVPNIRIAGISADEIDIRVVGTCGECRRRYFTAKHSLKSQRSKDALAPLNRRRFNGRFKRLKDS